MTIQSRLAHARAIRRAVREVFINGSGAGNRRGKTALFYEVTEDLITLLSDNQCRDLCRYFLQCTDLTTAERAQLLQILTE